MLYALNDLLLKMGAPEAAEKGRISWHYFDTEESEMAGSAEIKMIDGGNALTAELKHLRRNYEDDAGRVHSAYEESFYLHAEKNGAYYNVTKIAFDGEEYSHPQKAVVELGLSIFYARALDISILMVEQMFNKQDIFNAVEMPKAAVAELPKMMVPAHVQKALKKETWGVVIPFPVRRAAGSNVNHLGHF